MSSSELRNLGRWSWGCSDIVGRRFPSECFWHFPPPSIFHVLRSQKSILPLTFVCNILFHSLLPSNLSESSLCPQCSEVLECHDDVPWVPWWVFILIYSAGLLMAPCNLGAFVIYKRKIFTNYLMISFLQFSLFSIWIPLFGYWNSRSSLLIFLLFPPAIFHVLIKFHIHFLGFIL